MTETVVRAQIKKSIENPDKRMRIYFKQEYKAIKYGRFIPCDKQEENRGFCRFLSDAREEQFALRGDNGLSQLIMVTSISIIKFQ